MDHEAELVIIRRAYAKQVLATVSVDDPHVEAAFAEVRREDFLGAGFLARGRNWSNFVRLVSWNGNTHTPALSVTGST